MSHSRHFPSRGQVTGGFSLLELLIVMAVIGILVGIAAVNVSNLRRPADEAARGASVLLKTARARAIATTAAVRVQRPANSRTYEFALGASCQATTWTPQAEQQYPLPSDVTITAPTTAWTVCFNSRGTIDVPAGTTLAPVTFTDKKGRQRTLTVYAGGAAEIKP